MKHVKCVVLGDPECKKRQLLLTFATNAYPGEYIPTVFDCISANVMAEGLPPVNIQLWDIICQEDYKKLRPLSYQGTQVFLLCFSLVYPKTLENIEKVWYKDAHEYSPDIPIILAGLQSDLRDNFESKAKELRAEQMEPIPYKKGKEMAKRINARAYIECSAEKAKNLTELFDTTVRYALNPQAQPEEEEETCCRV